MSEDIATYHQTLADADREIGEVLYREISEALPEAESKVWHAHPVWFLDGNPTVGYSRLKGGVRLMFWSGADFDEPDLMPGSGKFKDASITYQAAGQIDAAKLRRWLKKSTRIQWDYKNLIKNRGKLERRQ